MTLENLDNMVVNLPTTSSIWRSVLPQKSSWPQVSQARHLGDQVEESPHELELVRDTASIFTFSSLSSVSKMNSLNLLISSRAFLSQPPPPPPSHLMCCSPPSPPFCIRTQSWSSASTIENRFPLPTHFHQNQLNWIKSKLVSYDLDEIWKMKYSKRN